MTDLLTPELAVAAAGPPARPRVAAAVRRRRGQDLPRSAGALRARAGRSRRGPRAARARAGDDGAQHGRRGRRADRRGRGVGAGGAGGRRRTRVERLALRGLGWARSLRGRPIDDVCERFRAASDGRGPAHRLAGAGRGAAARLARRAEPRAHGATRFLSLADERGEAVSYAWMRLNLCELELRAGEWATVSRLLDEWAESADEQLLITPTYQRCRALLAAGRGLADEARRWATPALAESQALGVPLAGARVPARARGRRAARARAGAAAEHLRAVWEHTRARGRRRAGRVPGRPGARRRPRGARRARRGRRP